MSKSVPYITLNDDKMMPQLGLGVWKASEAQAREAVRHAFETGYRSIDTAAAYNNERGVGEGLKDAALPRESYFVTTKVWNADQGAQAAHEAALRSLEQLGLDYVDLLLIHWPLPDKNLYVKTWKALIALKEEGRALSIGVSNFNPVHLQRLIDETGVTPAVNQIETHPYFQRADLREVHRKLGIHTEAWSPLAQGKVTEDPALRAIADKYGKTPAQVVLRWHLDNGVIVIPKSVTPERITSNFAVFDFALSDEDRARIDALDRNERLGPDPETFNLDT
ncbi:aldo/keto reductase [Pseudomonas sp. RIT-PI-S]|uniref:aldo/keto reductase n=1 Tax=Pseudomonas sp. RIT-PI-S TaxID=3035295 RepID=UPI0021D8658A|nr:aldo/keto reductase [Pseudomonas sp. RIT-PI-S]